MYILFIFWLEFIRFKTGFRGRPIRVSNSRYGAKLIVWGHAIKTGTCLKLVQKYRGIQNCSRIRLVKKKAELVNALSAVKTVEIKTDVVVEMLTSQHLETVSYQIGCSHKAPLFW